MQDGCEMRPLPTESLLRSACPPRVARERFALYLERSRHQRSSRIRGIGGNHPLPDRQGLPEYKVAKHSSGALHICHCAGSANARVLPFSVHVLSIKVGRRIAFWYSGHFPYSVLRSADNTDMTEVSRYATCQARYDLVPSFSRLTFLGRDWHPYLAK